MRPDEHKKKKNADYKKKHGISQHKDGKNNQGKKGKSSENETSKEKPAANEGIREPTEVVAAEQEARTFSRRKIKSNWERYDGNDVSDEDGETHSVQQRGADFATLVQGAGGSHSQFRFQDEKGWEDNASDTQAHGHQAILQINFQDLSETLKSLPLHKRLDLDEREVSLNLQPISKTAQDTAKQDASETSYSLNHNTVHQVPAAMLPNAPGKEENKTTNINTLPTGSNIVKKGNDSGFCSEKSQGISFEGNISQQSSTKMDKIIKNENISFTSKSKSKEVYDKDRNVSKGNAVKNDNNLFEDELELLLSLNSTANKQALKQNIDKNEENSQTCSTEDIEATCSEKKKLSIPEEAQELTGKSIVKKEEDLEDWLDSVLG